MLQPYRPPGGYEGDCSCYSTPRPLLACSLPVSALLSSPLSSARSFVPSRQERVFVLPTCQAVIATGSYGLHSAEVAHLRRRVAAKRGGA